MNKQSITRILFTVLISIMGVNTFAHDIEVKNADGVIIYYNYSSDGKELMVTYKGNDYYIAEYRGNVVIPEEVTYMNRKRKVTKIGEYAFASCSKLTSITIPKSVTSIGELAFYYCSGLTAVHITDLEAWCNIKMGSNPLSDAHHLYLNGEEVKDLVIPNSVTSIGNSAFCDCSGLTSITIPNSVTSIGNSAFMNCSGLTSITIPNSVTSIGINAFQDCI